MHTHKQTDYQHLYMGAMIYHCSGFQPKLPYSDRTVFDLSSTIATGLIVNNQGYCDEVLSDLFDKARLITMVIKF